MRSKGANEPITNSVRLIAPDAPLGCPDRGPDHAALADERTRDRPEPHAPPPLPPPAATSTTPPSAPDTPTGKALAQAKKDNRRVEIEALRSEKATYYANPDGKTVRMEQHLHPIRVKNAKGDGFTPPSTPRWSRPAASSSPRPSRAS
ncbi:hypothetical protein ACFSTC_37525 [Nonomuraea ferruginea]